MDKPRLAYTQLKHNKTIIGFKMPITYGIETETAALIKENGLDPDDLFKYHYIGSAGEIRPFNIFSAYGECKSAMKEFVSTFNDGTIIGKIGNPNEKQNLKDKYGLYHSEEPNTSDYIYVRLSTKRFPVEEGGPFKSEFVFNDVPMRSVAPEKFVKARESGKKEYRTGKLVVYFNTGDYSNDICSETLSDKNSEVNHFLQILGGYIFPHVKCANPECSDKAVSVNMYPYGKIKAEEGDTQNEMKAYETFIFPVCQGKCPTLIASIFKMSQLTHSRNIGVQTCFVCRKISSNYCVCGTNYCSKECQQKDWKVHKKKCVPSEHKEKR